MKHRYALTLITALLFSPAALADESVGRIGEAEWRDMAVGRTVHYLRADGTLHGSEHYHTDGQTAYWRWPDGECKEGSWSTWNVGGPIFCFDWPVTGASCWAHLREADGDILVIEVNEDGRLLKEEGAIFSVGDIEDEPFDCEQPGVT